ncbi:MAG: phosphatidylserine/phosphatidylglycerophosphate/cardiolipin synthase family protein [Verrucomicrobia bacterium]|nr:phosphatidylserine/phosphatidylglycerophosphate/cardiolipin synthase family protein [Verrucomicrobiota bacterium]
MIPFAKVHASFVIRLAKRKSLLFAGSAVIQSPAMNRLAKLLFASCVLLTVALPLARADRVCLINGPVDAAQSRYDLAIAAQRELNISYFYVGGEEDEFTMRGFALLRETARRGVKVRLMVDALFNSIPAHLGAYLVREGVEVRVFHPFNPLKPFRFNRRLHDKLFIADGQRLITGGRNIDNSYFGQSRFRKEGDTVYRNRIDRDILVEGGSAAEANTHFMTLWNGSKVKPMHVGKYRYLIRPDDSPKRLMASRRRAITPVHRAILHRDIDKAKAALDRAWAEFQSKPRVVQLPSHTDWNQRLRPVDKIRFFADLKGRKTRGQNTGFYIAELVNNAASGETIWIESPYLILTRKTRSVLGDALRRGVRVVVFTNSLNSSSNLLVQAVYQRKKVDHLALGLEIYELAGEPGKEGMETLHAKSMVLEQAGIGLVGSFNIDPRSERLNTEVAIEFHSEVMAGELLRSIRERIEKKGVRIGPDGMPVDGRPRYLGASPKKIRRMKRHTLPALIFKGWL